MNDYKYLLENVGLLTLSNFATKLLTFFLVPLYTNVLSTEEYGTYDLFLTTINVLLPICTLNIQEAILRFSLDNKLSRKAIVSIGTRYFIISNCIVAAGLIINSTFGIVESVKEYAVFFLLMFLAQSLSNLVMYYIRGIDRIADLSVSSIICSAATIFCNILFLLVFKWGLIGYFVANIIGPIIQCLYLIIRAEVFRDISVVHTYKAECKEMTAYSVPMIANSIAWWINNASDKYVVIWFCGLAENGIYSVASKIPSILNVFSTVFSQAWTLSAVKDFDPEDRNNFFSNTYAAYNCMLTLVCSIILIADKILARFLYAKNFYVAWRYAPWLTIALIFSALSNYLGGFFSAVKNTKMFAQSSMVGAVVNIILNIVFTPLIGAMGAAIATTISYFLVWIVRYVHSRKFIKMRVKLCRDVLSYLVLVVQAIVLLSVENAVIMYGLECGLFALILLLYAKDIRKVSDKIIGAIKSRRSV